MAVLPRGPKLSGSFTAGSAIGGALVVLCEVPEFIRHYKDKDYKHMEQQAGGLAGGLSFSALQGPAMQLLRSGGSLLASMLVGGVEGGAEGAVVGGPAAPITGIAGFVVGMIVGTTLWYVGERGGRAIIDYGQIVNSASEKKRAVQELGLLFEAIGRNLSNPQPADNDKIQQLVKLNNQVITDYQNSQTDKSAKADFNSHLQQLYGQITDLALSGDAGRKTIDTILQNGTDDEKKSVQNFYSHYDQNASALAKEQPATDSDKPQVKSKPESASPPAP